MTDPTAPPGEEAIFDWVDAWEEVQRNDRVLTGPTVSTLVEAGLPRDAVLAYAGIRASGQDESDALLRLPMVLRWLSMAAPGLSIEAGMEWALVVARCHRQGRTPNTVVIPWLHAGLGEHGWLFLAAGVPLAEACTQVESGVVDLEALRTLAALRGPSLPA